MAFGIMWKNAPPSNEPAASATSGTNSRSRADSVSTRVMLPTMAMPLMAVPSTTIQASVLMAIGPETAPGHSAMGQRRLRTRPPPHPARRSMLRAPTHTAILDPCRSPPTLPRSGSSATS